MNLPTCENCKKPLWYYDAKGKQTAIYPHFYLRVDQNDEESKNRYLPSYCSATCVQQKLDEYRGNGEWEPESLTNLPTLEELKTRYVDRVLVLTAGNLSLASRILGVTRKHLWENGWRGRGHNGNGHEQTKEETNQSA